MAVFVNGKKVAGLGIPGKDGKSAYQIAEENGYTGTEEEFNTALGNLNDKPVFLITVSNDTSGYIADKTFSEIHQAYNNGKVLIAYFSPSQCIFQLSNVDVDSVFVFNRVEVATRIDYNTTTVTRSLIVISADNTVVFYTEPEVGEASTSYFDNSDTDLQAETVQGAIEELASKPGSSVTLVRW